jgi:phage portal protein BeeE
MGIGKNLLQAARDYLESGDEAKAYTLLSQDDLKAAVPMFMEGGGQGSSGVVPIYSSMQALDNQINRFLNGWHNSKINYAAEIGDLSFNVLIVSAIRWAGTNLSTGRAQVVELDADEKEDPINDHPLLSLFKQPNPDTTARVMWKQFACSWVPAGEAYYLIGRDNAGRPKELYYEPHVTIEPRWDKQMFPEDETANDLIQYFEIKRNGRWIPWRKKDVFRVYYNFDPVTRRGWNGIDALMRTIFTDNEREQYTALLLKNFGVTPKGVAPKTSGLKFDTTAMSNDLQRRWSGDDRGKPMAFNEPMEVLDFSTDFSADAMEKIAHISENRVCAALGISAQSLKFGSAQKSSTYNNVREFRREDYEQWVMPTHEDFLAAAENQLLRDMDSNERHVLRFDYSKVPIVQRDKMETAKETDMLVRNRTINQAEARERHGYDFDDPKFQDVWFPVQAATLTLSPIGASPSDEEKPAPDPMADEDEETKAAKTRLPKSQLDEGAETWREHDALTPAERELIDSVPYVNGKVS